jgi:hypothetical protein
MGHMSAKEQETMMPGMIKYLKLRQLTDGRYSETKE